MALHGPPSMAKKLSLLPRVTQKINFKELFSYSKDNRTKLTDELVRSNLQSLNVTKRANETVDW